MGPLDMTPATAPPGYAYQCPPFGQGPCRLVPTGQRVPMPAPSNPYAPGFHPGTVQVPGGTAPPMGPIVPQPTPGQPHPGGTLLPGAGVPQGPGQVVYYGQHAGQNPQCCPCPS